MHDERATVAAYFKNLDLHLSPRNIKGVGRKVVRWHLHRGNQVFRINGKADFASVNALWLAWYCMHPVFEHGYQKALAFAEEVQGWSDARKRTLAHWFDHQEVITRETQPYVQWRWPNPHINNLRRPGEPVVPPWAGPNPAPLLPDAATAAALMDPAWQQRALVTARFDPQFAALFLPALKGLLDEAERVILRERLAESADDAPVRVRRRL